MGQAVPMVIGRHSHPGARAEPGVEAPPPATGIDYLRLVEARADAVLEQRISYAGMPDGQAQPALPGADGANGSLGGDGDEVAR